LLPNTTAAKLLEVPEDLEVQSVPLGEVKIWPAVATATNQFLPKAIPPTVARFANECEVHESVSLEANKLPSAEPATT